MLATDSAKHRMVEAVGACRGCGWTMVSSTPRRHVAHVMDGPPL